MWNIEDKQTATSFTEKRGKEDGVHNLASGQPSLFWARFSTYAILGKKLFVGTFKRKWPLQVSMVATTTTDHTHQAGLIYFPLWEHRHLSEEGWAGKGSRQSI